MYVRLLIVLTVVVSTALQAEVRLARLFSEHAVLQSGTSVPVWGWAEAGEEVEVKIAGQTQKTTAAPDGKWSVKLASLTAGGPHTMTVSGSKNTVTVGDVLIGEVWLGSGQSNMAMTVSRAKDYEKEKAAAKLSTLRMFTVRGSVAASPQDDAMGEWVVCAPETVGNFSATAFFFGRDIQRELKVPVGLINSSVGGTPIDSWLDETVQRQCKELAPMLAVSKPDPKHVETMKVVYQKQLADWKANVKKARAAGTNAPRAPLDPVVTAARKSDVGGLFNGKIAPLIPYAVRGFLWYQGEANSVESKAPYYRYQLPMLVQDWRKRWGGGDLPFAWVQLPNFVGRGEGWCMVRDAMFRTLRLPNTGMAVTTDIGDNKDIHPKNKQEVGRRLAQWALGSVYGKGNAVSGPRYVSHEIIGPHVVVKMSHTDGGIVGKEGVKGFTICGADHVWKPALVRVDGDKLFVSCPEVPKPVAVRYGWADVPEVSLWNGAGLPASPFRTDDFPMTVASPRVEVRKAVPAAKSTSAVVR